jgi:hypothetical protein
MLLPSGGPRAESTVSNNTPQCSLRSSSIRVDTGASAIRRLPSFAPVSRGSGSVVFRVDLLGTRGYISVTVGSSDTSGGSFTLTGTDSSGAGGGLAEFTAGLSSSGMGVMASFIAESSSSGGWWISRFGIRRRIDFWRIYRYEYEWRQWSKFLRRPCNN